MSLGKHAMLPGVLGVTVAFAVGSIATTVGLAIVLGLTDPQYASVPLSRWMDFGLELFTYALVSGLVVDTIRFVAKALWSGDPHYAETLTELMNRNLTRTR